MNLAEALNSPDTVLFIGSGVSAWSGLPSWGGMLNELADYLDRNGISSELVRAEVKYGDLLQAASYGFDKLTRHQQGDFIRLACRYGSARPNPLHKLLVTLGPRCFITTNYDNLIEEALRLWRPNDFFRPPITNLNLIGMPEIVQARATDFIFKPHGDAADSESIVLTREQYRVLLPGGERQAALESVKTLLVSRPVIYVGFGLRDPDFLYLKDVLLNIYKGGTRDHFALMADVSVEQKDYWRRSYGIHLISYPTSVRSDGSKDHSALQTLLETASRSIVRMDAVSKLLDANDPKTLLALARYASSLSQSTKKISEFPIRVHRMQTRSFENRGEMDHLSGAKVEVLLDRFVKKTILIGLPGAGKSYSMRKSVARLAEQLHDACLQDTPNAANLVVPIFVDLKLYQGSLENLIAASLPVGIHLHGLLERFTVRIYLDSFNEVPRKFVESGECETDLQAFVQAIGSVAIAISSRTMDGLDGLGFDAYELAEIEENSVFEELRKRGISLGGRFEPEMMALLQRPFYFRYILDGEVALPYEPHPREFYRTLIEGAGQTLAAKLGQSIDLIRILRPVAYEALNSGQEAFPLDMLLCAIEANSLSNTKCLVNASEIANGLVACSVLVPYSGERVAFVHQSITEYLASLELAERFAKTPGLLREKLSLRRWDQALFLALSHLRPPFDQEFFQGVLDIDLNLAVASVKFVETEREKLVAELLNELIRRRESIDSHDFTLSQAMTSGFPANEAHLPALNLFIQSKHPLKGAAAECVIGICGEASKAEYLKLFVEFKNDYNFCANVIGTSLAQFATQEDLATLAQWSRELDANLQGEFQEADFDGFVSGVAAFSSLLPLNFARQHLFPISRDELAASPIRVSILREILREHTTTEGLQCACDLLLLGDKDAAISIYFILSFSKPENQLSVQSLTTTHIDALLNNFSNDETTEAGWSWDAIMRICKMRPDLRPIVEAQANRFSGLSRASLLMCSHQGHAPAFAALEALLQADAGELDAAANAKGIEHWRLNWSGNEKLFLRLLERKNSRLCHGLLGSGIPCNLEGFERIEIQNTNWWLEWLAECVVANDTWLVAKLSYFMARHTNEALARRLVAEFNDQQSKHRSLLISYVLPCFAHITTDDLSSEAATFAVHDLLQVDENRVIGHFLGDSFLGTTATESFVVERLVPLLSQASGIQAKKIRIVLNEAGQRHGRRYF